jgi:DNA-binding transcriptional MerR regulator
MTKTDGHLRIGELGRRVGVSPELLRAWERRYGLLEPTRSPGGFRLYSDADEVRVRTMQRHLQQGLSAAEASRAALEVATLPEQVATTNLADTAAELQGALERYDESTANAVLDGTLATFGTETVLRDVVMPVLRTLGERWEAGELTVAQEHFASHLLRGRLLGVARGWGRGSGSVALLACAPGEMHDLPLVLFGIALREAGWRIVFLGADTPIATVEHAADTIAPAAVIFATTVPEPLLAVEKEVADLATRVPVGIGGRAADKAVAERIGAFLLEGDPALAAATLASRIST